MRFFKRNWILLSLFAMSTFAGIFYFHYRGSVFRTPPEQDWLTYQFSKEEIADFVAPFDNVDSNQLVYSTETFTDRNSVKYLEKTAKDDRFDDLLTTENIPLWGWIIRIQKPLPITLKISHLRELIGISFSQQLPGTVIAFPDLLKQIETKLGKKFADYKSVPVPSSGDTQKFKYEKKIVDTDLLERITLTLDHGRFRNMESNLFLPMTYADEANQSIEKQKTLHLFFNLFNYFLIGLVFLTLFHVYDSRHLFWKRSFAIFSVFFVAQFISHLFETNFHSNISYAFFHTLLKTISESIWIYLLIVISDFVSRTTQRMPHSLLDLTRKSFLVSENFRSSVILGWAMAIIQVIFVWNFYKIISQFSAYIPLKIPGEHSQHCTLEFLQYFSDSLSTAIREEVLYRLFFIGLFISIFRRATVAIIFSSILWGFLHFSYQFEPYYVRGIELSLIGFFYGWMMVRYGIVSVLVAHFVYNSFILSEYEYQFSGYLLGVNLLLAIICFISYLFRNSTQPFQVEHEDFPPIIKKNESYTERRNIYERIYPVNSKYIWISLIVLIVTAIWFPIRYRLNPATQNSRLITMSSDLVSNYMDISSTWNVTYYQDNPAILEMKNQSEKLPKEERSAILNDLKNQEVLTTIRYFSHEDNRVICDFDFSSNEELLRMNCPNLNVNQPIPFDTREWLETFKKNQETWSLLDQRTKTNGQMIYSYAVHNPATPNLETTIFIISENNHIIQFKKMTTLNTSLLKATHDEKPMLDNVLIMILSVVSMIFMICFIRLFIVVAKQNKFYEKKSAVGAFLTFIIFILWNINSYKKFLIGFDSSITLQHFLANQVMYQLALLMAVTFGTYVLMYAFFHFPPFVYKHAPTSEQWNGILVRPIWRWRNAKTSLLYSVLLVCIQTFLSMFIQLANKSSDLDLFHFDILYLNHEYLFITFVGIVWKYVLFWMLVLVTITSLEKYVRRWLYLSIIAMALIINAVLFRGAMGPKLIELSSIFIVFYFIYRIVRFDFAFYGWFILLNALFTFIPILFHAEYQNYSQQIYVLVIVIAALAIFTFYRNSKISKELVSSSTN